MDPLLLGSYPVDTANGGVSLDETIGGIRLGRVRAASRIRALRAAWARDLMELEQPDAVLPSGVVFTAGATGWHRIIGACEWSRIVSSSAAGRAHYIRFGGEDEPKGTGADTTGALLLSAGTPVAVPCACAWIYCTSGDVVRLEWGALSLVGAPGVVQVLDAEEIPTGTPATVACLVTATLLAAADARRVLLEVTNKSTTYNVWASFSASPVVGSGIYLPAGSAAGRSRWWTGRAAKGALYGIADGGTANVATEKATV